MKKEIQIKKWPKAKKEAIIANHQLLKKLQIAVSAYSPYNLNIFNELFYKYAEKKLIDQLPNLFTKLDLFNLALHKKITTESNSNLIKIVELASGKTINRWKTFIDADKKRKWELLLTDFDQSLLPNPTTLKNSTNFKFSTAIYNLFDNFPILKQNEKFDTMLSTYTFDNIWLENDLHLTKTNNIWYKSIYKLNLTKAKKQVQDINKEKKLNKQFFQNIIIKTKKIKMNISSLKYGSYINEYFKNSKQVSVNYPGGLINKIVSSHNSQLKKNGIFITADIATTTTIKKSNGFKTVNQTIKIKVENYTLAKYILEKLGYSVDLKNLHDFLKEAGIITPVKIYDHFILAVKLKN